MYYESVRPDLGPDCLQACMEPENFVSPGPTQLRQHFFLADEGREDPNTTINRPSSALQRNTT